MEIDELFSKYQIDNEKLIEYIKNVANEKHNAGDWDLGVNSESDNLLYMLLYEYATSIEKITEGQVYAKKVVDKLSNQMGRFRFGDYKQGKDDLASYDGYSVTSEAYKKKCRIDGNFGAHAVEYKDDQGFSKTAVALFDDKQKAQVDGTEYTLSGIDLGDLSDIRHTAFHEWTHIMEKCMVKASALDKRDIVLKDGYSIYINALLSSDLSMQEYGQYVSSVDELLKTDELVTFGGISTIELNYKKSPNRRIMHNQISEGATELISRMVMEELGLEVNHPDRYAEEVKIIGDLFSSIGNKYSITTYITESYKIIRLLEQYRLRGKNLLHYISDFINSKGKSGSYRDLEDLNKAEEELE